jgi:6-phosphogluconolactonase (cycloisomerase 2 family)
MRLSQISTSPVALYASVGAMLTRYAVDVEAAELTVCETVELPENVHYAWPHASGRYLYVATSNSPPGLGPAGDSHHVTAFALERKTGALTRHGVPIALPTRPIHISTDIPSRNLLVAFSNPGDFRIYRIADDATLGSEVPQRTIDIGIYPHQVLPTPDGKRVILVTRGHDPREGKPEEPGALKVFEYEDGVLGREASIAPNDGFGFGPRHLDFHPTQPWIYVSLERQNALSLFTMDQGEVAEAPVCSLTTLTHPDDARQRQLAGTVHVHPNGCFVYGVNRASAAVQFQGRRVFAGGENSFAVYAIDPRSGRPTLIQHADTRGIHCRTFHIDPSGRLLVAAHIEGMDVQDGDAIHTIPARLSLFRIGEDGRLSFVRAYDVDVGDKMMFWMGMVRLEV